MTDARQGTRELDFGELVAELRALIGRRVVIEVGAAGRPFVISSAGTLCLLMDAGPDRSGVRRVVIAVSDVAGTCVALSEREVVSAAAWSAGGARAGVDREVQVQLAGGAELFVSGS